MMKRMATSPPRKGPKPTDEIERFWRLVEKHHPTWLEPAVDSYVKEYASSDVFTRAAL
jgi:hypothetical protein